MNARSLSGAFKSKYFFFFFLEGLFRATICWGLKFTNVGVQWRQAQRKLPTPIKKQRKRACSIWTKLVLLWFQKYAGGLLCFLNLRKYIANVHCKKLSSTSSKQVLTYWFARKNVDDTVIFLQYLLLSQNRFVQLLAIMCNSNLEDGHITQDITFCLWGREGDRIEAFIWKIRYGNNMLFAYAHGQSGVSTIRVLSKTDRQTDKFFDTIYGGVWIFSFS